MSKAPIFTVRDVVTARGAPYKPVERLVALAIADHMGSGDAPAAWPSIRTIAVWTGLHRATVVRALEVLCKGPGALFELVAGGSPLGGARASNTYRLRAAVPVAESDQSLSTTSRTQRHDQSHTATRLVAGCVTEGTKKEPRRDQRQGSDAQSDRSGRFPKHRSVSEIEAALDRLSVSS
jgi:hypothetical protein